MIIFIFKKRNKDECNDVCLFDSTKNCWGLHKDEDIQMYIITSGAEEAQF